MTASAGRRAGRRALRLAGALALLPAGPALAAPDLYNTSDLAFGTVSSVAADRVASDSLCIAGLLGGTYGVTATGSGAGGAFAMSAGAGVSLPFEVQWAQTGGASAGAPLTAGRTLGGQSASLLNCTLGLINNATVIVVLRAAALSAASAGSYSGTLQITLSPQ